MLVSRAETNFKTKIIFLNNYHDVSRIFKIVKLFIGNFKVINRCFGLTENQKDIKNSGKIIFD